MNMMVTATKQPPPYLEGDRGCGKTQCMINRLVEAVVEGQSPICIVVCHSRDFGLSHVLPRIKVALITEGMAVRNFRQGVVETDGARIDLATPSDLPHRYRGSIVSEFWDHHASEIEVERIQREIEEQKARLARLCQELSIAKRR